MKRNRKKSKKKKLIIAGAAAAAVPALVIAVAEVMAFRIVKTSVHMPDKDKNTYNPETNRKHENNPDIQTVTMQTFDNISLLGHWYPCEDAERTVICMHGWHGSWLKDFGDIIDFLHESHCNILLPDERGQNSSEGSFMGFALLERYDCLEWIKWVNNKVSPDLPVYIYGVSMGSATVMMTSALDLPGNVKGVIADCGFTSPQDIWRYLTNKTMHLPYGKLMELLTERRYAGRTGIKGTKYSSVDALQDCDIPVLFVHGSEDDFVPTKMTYINFEAFNGEKEMLIINGAGHAVNYRTDPESYEAAVKRLWAKCEV